MSPSDEACLEPSAPRFTGRVRTEATASAPALARGCRLAFSPGARTVWLRNSTGQTLVVTAGEGLHQRWGRLPERIRSGDVLWIPAGEKHWYGAATGTLSTLALLRAPDTETEWLEDVGDGHYRRCLNLMST